jgi:predicted Zn-dependent protease
LLITTGSMQLLLRLSTAALGLSIALAPNLSAAQGVEAAPDCGALENPAYGPFDYRKAVKQQRDLVENAHFTRGVETLSRQKTGPFGWDIGYTLRAFPNHHRALLSMQHLVDREKRNPATDAVYTIECYYERAIRFVPNDQVVRLLYVNLLINQGRLGPAEQHLDYTIRIAADEPFTQMNAGKLFFDMKRYDRALEQAHKAQSLGFPVQQLKERLTSVGRWVEPPPAAPASAASAP